MNRAGALALCVLVLCAAAATPSPIVATAQILDYEQGFIFFTTGDGFKVAPDVVVLHGPPVARSYARVTFTADGTVTEIDVSRKKLPPEGDLAAIHRFAVALSSPVPNPELVPPKSTDLCANVRPGKLVSISITVQVPPTTALTDSVYMTSDTSAWNPQAYRLDRIDALHYRSTLRLFSGTIMRVLFDRGSMQSVQVGENGLEQTPYVLCIGDEDAQAFTRTVYRWDDDTSGGLLPIPQTMPTPYNPAPFPNLPTPHP